MNPEHFYKNVHSVWCCRSSRKFIIMAIIIIIIHIIVFSWLPVFEKHLQKVNNYGVIHIGNGNSVGSSTKKTKKHVFTKMNRSNNSSRNSNNNNKKKDTRHSYCTYRTESAPLSIWFHNAHNNHTRLLRTPLALILEASYLTSWYNTSNKQINTYIYSTYIGNEG